MEYAESTFLYTLVLDGIKCDCGGQTKALRFVLHVFNTINVDMI